MFEFPDLTLILGQLRSGLTTAMFLFLIASGLSLIFGVLKIINFAHGSLYMIGAYVAWYLVHYLLGNGFFGFWAAVLIAAAVFLWYRSTDVLPDQVAYVTPYVATLLVLSLASQRLRMPAADGRPYIKGQEH